MTTQSQNNGRWPDFFLIGAPKCGTTSMDIYLAQHPEIYMSPLKEMHFFGQPEIGIVPATRDESTYRGVFAAAQPKQQCGESSVRYLYSRKAASQIRHANPDAKIIVMLRDPVGFMVSMHNQQRYNLTEKHADFTAALAAEAERVESSHNDDQDSPGRTDYRAQAIFSRYVRPYLEIFGRDQVHVMLLDDVRRDPAIAYRGVCEFLGVDPSFKPEFEIHNVSKAVRIGWLQRVIMNQNLRGFGKRLMPDLVATRIGKTLYAWNRIPAKPSGIDADLAAQLRQEFDGETRDLEALIHRDLSSWRIDPT
ncbi:MAG: sulfotransferase [Planctomycetota bacterium]